MIRLFYRKSTSHIINAIFEELLESGLVLRLTESHDALPLDLREADRLVDIHQLAVRLVAAVARRRAVDLGEKTQIFFKSI